MRYRMKNPTLAVVIRDGQKVPVRIPKGGEIEVVDGPLDGDRLLDVRWDRKTVLMFTSDIRERGEPLDVPGR
jgi:hypothetical protein